MYYKVIEQMFVSLVKCRLKTILRKWQRQNVLNRISLLDDNFNLQTLQLPDLKPWLQFPTQSENLKDSH